MVIVQTPVVDDVKVGVRLDVAVAVSVGELPKVWELGLAKVMVCVPLGVAELDAPEAEPVPIALVAVTVAV